MLQEFLKIFVGRLLQEEQSLRTGQEFQFKWAGLFQVDNMTGYPVVPQGPQQLAKPMKHLGIGILVIRGGA